jgi:hypothetical protein
MKVKGKERLIKRIATLSNACIFFYSELSTKYMKYCNILDRNADNLPLNSFLLNLQKQKIQR